MSHLIQNIAQRFDEFYHYLHTHCLIAIQPINEDFDNHETNYTHHNNTNLCLHTIIHYLQSNKPESKNYSFLMQIKKLLHHSTQHLPKSAQLRQQTDILYHVNLYIQKSYHIFRGKQASQDDMLQIEYELIQRKIYILQQHIFDSILQDEEDQRFIDYLKADLPIHTQQGLKHLHKKRQQLTQYTYPALYQALSKYHQSTTPAQNPPHLRSEFLYLSHQYFSIWPWVKQDTLSELQEELQIPIIQIYAQFGQTHSSIKAFTRQLITQGHQIITNLYPQRQKHTLHHQDYLFWLLEDQTIESEWLHATLPLLQWYIGQTSFPSIYTQLDPEQRKLYIKRGILALTRRFLKSAEHYYQTSIQGLSIYIDDVHHMKSDEWNFWHTFHLELRQASHEITHLTSPSTPPVAWNTLSLPSDEHNPPTVITLSFISYHPYITLTSTPQKNSIKDQIPHTDIHLVTIKNDYTFNQKEILDALLFDHQIVQDNQSDILHYLSKKSETIPKILEHTHSDLNPSTSIQTKQLHHYNPGHIWSELYFLVLTQQLQLHQNQWHLSIRSPEHYFQTDRVSQLLNHWTRLLEQLPTEWQHTLHKTYITRAISLDSPVKKVLLDPSIKHVTHLETIGLLTTDPYYQLIFSDPMLHLAIHEQAIQQFQQDLAPKHLHTQPHFAQQTAPQTQKNFIQSYQTLYQHIIRHQTLLNNHAFLFYLSQRSNYTFTSINHGLFLLQDSMYLTDHTQAQLLEATLHALCSLLENKDLQEQRKQDIQKAYHCRWSETDLINPVDTKRSIQTHTLTQNQATIVSSPSSIAKSPHITNSPELRSSSTAEIVISQIPSLEQISQNFLTLDVERREELLADYIVSYPPSHPFYIHLQSLFMIHCCASESWQDAYTFMQAIIQHYSQPSRIQDSFKLAQAFTHITYQLNYQVEHDYWMHVSYQLAYHLGHHSYCQKVLQSVTSQVSLTLPTNTFEVLLHARIHHTLMLNQTLTAFRLMCDQIQNKMDFGQTENISDDITRLKSNIDQLQSSPSYEYLDSILHCIQGQLNYHLNHHNLAIKQFSVTLSHTPYKSSQMNSYSAYEQSYYFQALNYLSLCLLDSIKFLNQNPKLQQQKDSIVTTVRSYFSKVQQNSNAHIHHQIFSIYIEIRLALLLNRNSEAMSKFLEFQSLWQHRPLDNNDHLYSYIYYSLAYQEILQDMEYTALELLLTHQNINLEQFEMQALKNLHGLHQIWHDPKAHILSNEQFKNTWQYHRLQTYRCLPTGL